jgi:hypothetical protein
LTSGEHWSRGHLAQAELRSVVEKVILMIEEEEEEEVRFEWEGEVNPYISYMYMYIRQLVQSDQVIRNTMFFSHEERYY